MVDHEVIYLKDRPETYAGQRSALGNLDAALSEANHRISNNLALLASSVSLRANAIAREQRDLDSDDVAQILRDVSARITIVGQLHRLLSSQPETERLDLCKTLEEICDTLVAALAPAGQVDLIKTSDGPCVVGSKQVLPLCLIVTEAVTNSLKYAHPAGVKGKLMVGCREEGDGTIAVEVADDGVGLPEDLDLAEDGGLGSRTIRALARQLNAEISFESQAIGLTFRLRIPPSGVDERSA